VAVDDNAPREKRTCEVSAMGPAKSWMGAGEGLGRPMREMDDTRQEDTLLRDL